ncbi:MAG TPA: GTP-binding protein [Vicinamibacterales bacterium]|nr:GTP-binding protein [Vicinamibacterales bacterium]
MQTEMPAGAGSVLAATNAEALAPTLPIVITGHVDHGKSTIVGRLLADTGSLPDGKLEAVRANCERHAKPFEYAFLLDALKDEQAQGITIDAARVFFRSPKRRYIIIDAPGHIEFLKNMVTGASRAQAALLVIDAHEGIRENSRRHGYMLSMLGIRQIAVAVNKMDLVGWSRDTFEQVTAEYSAFLAQIGIAPAHVIPVSGMRGDNIAAASVEMPWYTGPTVLDALDSFRAAEPPTTRSFRMPVQGVYKFTGQNDSRRIVAGTPDTGTLRVGDDVLFYPSGKKSRVHSIEAFNRPPQTELHAGQAAGFTLEEQIYITRGELAVRAGEPAPHVSTRIRVSLFWLGRAPFLQDKDYVLKLGTSRVPARLESIERVIDASDLQSSASGDRVGRHEVAECTLTLGRPLAFDTGAEFEATSRFVIVDDFDISGGGIIRESLTDPHSGLRESVLRRNLKWSSSGVPLERRSERLSQRPALLVITGEASTDRKRLARALETRLFDEGRHVYFLAIGNLLYGVDADLERTEENRPEHVRRLGEVANILLDAGLIVIATAIDLAQEDAERLRTAVGADRVAFVWMGDDVATDLTPDLIVGDDDDADATMPLKALLQQMGVIFRPW